MELKFMVTGLRIKCIFVHNRIITGTVCVSSAVVLVQIKSHALAAVFILMLYVK